MVRVFFLTVVLESAVGGCSDASSSSSSSSAVCALCAPGQQPEVSGDVFSPQSARWTLGFLCALPVWSDPLPCLFRTSHASSCRACPSPLNPPSLSRLEPSRSPVPRCFRFRMLSMVNSKKYPEPPSSHTSPVICDVMNDSGWVKWEVTG
ncbi:hypothetical protein EYF80_021856 [Liparis tanakae]|uniref:Secreted protein n=1 Tax=Liparis tanakae TaxID=230148 RepID=A0A4Z2HQ32_9TELE|nr:hypothetical protein EYF80_021856 [Liparis tanakae]